MKLRILDQSFMNAKVGADSPALAQVDTPRGRVSKFSAVAALAEEIFGEVLTSPEQNQGAYNALTIQAHFAQVYRHHRSQEDHRMVYRAMAGYTRWRGYASMKLHEIFQENEMIRDRILDISNNDAASTADGKEVEALCYELFENVRRALAYGISLGYYNLAAGLASDLQMHDIALKLVELDNTLRSYREEAGVFIQAKR